MNAIMAAIMHIIAEQSDFGLIIVYPSDTKGSADSFDGVVDGFVVSLYESVKSIQKLSNVKPSIGVTLDIILRRLFKAACDTVSTDVAATSVLK